MKGKVCLAAVLMSVALFGVSAQADYTVVNSMNFRSEPSAFGASVGTVPVGSTVEVLGSSDGWDYISFNGNYGWIHGGNLTTSSPAQVIAQQQNRQTYNAAGGNGYNINTNPAYPVTSGSETVTVLAGMNFRSAPSIAGTIIGSIPAGTTVSHVGTSNGWDVIVYNGVQGYIAGGYISSPTTGTAGSAYTAGTAGSAYTAAAATTGGSYSAGRVGAAMNFRSAPGLTSSVMGIIPVGASVQYVSSSNGYDQVVYQGSTGWIKSGNIQ